MQIFGKQKYRLVGPEFMHAAPDGYAGEATVPVSADDAWQVLVESDWSDWYPTAKQAAWTSEPPYGQGSTRGMYRRRVPPFESQVVVWQPARHLLLSMTRGGAFEYAAAAEEFVFQPLSPGSCHLRWRFAFETQGATSKMMWLPRLFDKVHPLTGAMARRVPAKFADYAARHTGSL